MLPTDLSATARIRMCIIRYCRGTQLGHVGRYRGTEMDMSLLPKTKVEVVVSKIPVEKVIEAAHRVLHTGNIGDGKIFVYDVEKIFRVRTGEYDYDALQSDNE